MSVLRSLRLLAGVAAVLVYGCAPDSTNETFSPRSIAGDPRFGYAREALEALVNERGSPGEHHFCVVGVRDRPEIAWVHWREQRQLIEWKPLGADVPEEILYLDMTLTTDWIDLEDGVVESQEDVGSSTYLVTRAFVDSILSACDEVGEQFSIQKAPEASGSG